MTAKKALVPIADGSEEIEAVTIIDVLRRAGAQVTVASVQQRRITASRGVVIEADTLIAECADTIYDVIALPGGMPGAEYLQQNEILKTLLEDQARQGRLYAAICAAPAVVLHTHGLLKQRQATGHPNFMDKMPEAMVSERSVVVDGNCVTSRGPGTALVFALTLVEMLYGRDKRLETALPMVTTV